MYVPTVPFALAASNHPHLQNCQDYLRFLSQSITTSALASLSPPTSIIVIGCGTASLIRDYITFTDTPFPVYADPSRKLYDILRMTQTLSLGSKAPEYMQSGILKGAIKSIWQELRAGRKMFDGGDWAQVGGEFLFEEGTVGWCHRMRNTRDHAELGELRRLLGLDGPSHLRQRSPRKRWSMAAIGGGGSSSGKGSEGGSLGRRLSKRMSWQGGKKTQTRTQTNGNGNGALIAPEKKIMDQLREEGETNTARGTGTEDALAKLTNGAPKAYPHMNGSIHPTANGSVNTAAPVPQATPHITDPHTPAISPAENNSTHKHANPAYEESGSPVTPASGEVMTGWAVHRRSSVLPAEEVQVDETPTGAVDDRKANGHLDGDATG